MPIRLVRCVPLLSLLVSRDENEMTIAEANGITHSSGRCNDNSIAKSGTTPAELSRPLPGRQRLDKHPMRDKAAIPVSWLVETSCLPAQL